MLAPPLPLTRARTEKTNPFCLTVASAGPKRQHAGAHACNGENCSGPVRSHLPSKVPRAQRSWPRHHRLPVMSCFFHPLAPEISVITLLDPCGFNTHTHTGQDASGATSQPLHAPYLLSCRPQSRITTRQAPGILSCTNLSLAVLLSRVERLASVTRSLLLTALLRW